MNIFRNKTKKIGRKAQGLPIYVIVIIIIGLIALTVLLLYAFGVIGKGISLSDLFFNLGGNITENASQEAGALSG